MGGKLVGRFVTRLPKTYLLLSQIFGTVHKQEQAFALWLSETFCKKNRTLVRLLARAKER
jgi:hypothetical protein